MILEWLTSTTFLVFLVVLLLSWWSTRRPATLPPGPPLFPILGNILQMRVDPRRAFNELRKRYGDIFCVYFTTRRPVVVLNSYSLVKEAFLKRGDQFSDRPAIGIFDQLSQGRGIVNVSGKMWREQRTFALTTLREFGMGKSLLENKINEEVTVFLEALEGTKGEPTDLRHVIGNAVANIICSIVFGQRFEYTDKLFATFLQLSNENIAYLRTAGIVGIFSFLKYLPGDRFHYHKLFHNVDVTENGFFRPMIKQHMKSLEDDPKGDFIAAYLTEMKRRQGIEEDTTMTEETLVKVIGDLFVAGSESTATALRWLLVVFLNFPEVQQRCFQEIRDNIGLNRAASMKDKTSLPYVEATIMETLRFCNITPLAAPHSTSENVQLQGYLLPKGTTVLANVDAILRDPDVWEEPDSFRPERFLDSSGKFTKPDELIPFSLGRRLCLGESLARMEIFLFLTAMIQRFEFMVPDGEKPSLKGDLGITHSPKSFTVIAKSRA